ncbi:MAG: hypothetical protein ACXAB8_15150 [Promethearchaeota archaeon]|jgi:branched-subunit amino acid ABC-type transport system permease component
MVVEEIIIYGAVQGAVYALLALGYSLVYGVGGILMPFFYHGWHLVDPL